MTMLFAFTSLSHDTTFLGSDDLNSLNGKRTDKVKFMVGRYLVGVIGSVKRIRGLEVTKPSQPATFGEYGW